MNEQIIGNYQFEQVVLLVALQILFVISLGVIDRHRVETGEGMTHVSTSLMYFFVASAPCSILLGIPLAFLGAFPYGAHNNLSFGQAIAECYLWIVAIFWGLALAYLLIYSVGRYGLPWLISKVKSRYVFQKID